MLCCYCIYNIESSLMAQRADESVNHWRKVFCFFSSIIFIVSYIIFQIQEQFQAGEINQSQTSIIWHHKAGATDWLVTHQRKTIGEGRYKGKWVGPRSQSEWLTGGGVWYECLVCHLGPRWHDKHKQAQKINNKQNAKKEKKKEKIKPQTPFLPHYRVKYLVN